MSSLSRPRMELMRANVVEWEKCWGLVGLVGVMIFFAIAFVIVVRRGVVLEVCPASSMRVSIPLRHALIYIYIYEYIYIYILN